MTLKRWFHIVGARWHVDLVQSDGVSRRACNRHPLEFYGPADVDGYSDNPPEAKRCKKCEWIFNARRLA